ncbi:hypothetical protein [Paenarthrobacter sp. C1]|uniref:hypothetical protein n=1 Tax=Paenarthrobacter sp. C1 TaxID=3400220 RepID=UPI003BF5D293
MRDDNVVQLALFGPAVPARQLVLPSDEVSEETQRTLDVMDELQTQVETLLDAFPPEEREQAARGLYLDADDHPRTRHGALRAVS